MNALERRIIELSYQHKLSHISSCLNTVNVLAGIYAKKNPQDICILANGHAGLALYVVLESLGICDAEKMIEKHGVHPSRDPAHGIYCSAGSLGQAETIAVGVALADKSRTVYLVTSDGSCMEGSVCEAMRVGRKHCPNLDVTVVFNNLGAYGRIETFDLPKDVQNDECIQLVDQSRYPEWLRGLSGHYLVLTETQRDELLT